MKVLVELEKEEEVNKEVTVSDDDWEEETQKHESRQQTAVGSY